MRTLRETQEFRIGLADGHQLVFDALNAYRAHDVVVCARYFARSLNVLGGVYGIGVASLLGVCKAVSSNADLTQLFDPGEARQLEELSVDDFTLGYQQAAAAGAYAFQQHHHVLDLQGGYNWSLNVNDSKMPRTSKAAARITLRGHGSGAESGVIIIISYLLWICLPQSCGSVFLDCHPLSVCPLQT
jgi:hypothetical protein